MQEEIAMSIGGRDIICYQGHEHDSGFKALKLGCGHVLLYLGEEDEIFYCQKQHNGRFQFLDNINQATFFTNENDAWEGYNKATRGGWESSYPKSDFQILSPDEVLVALIMEN